MKYLLGIVLLVMLIIKIPAYGNEGSKQVQIFNRTNVLLYNDPTNKYCQISYVPIFSIRVSPNCTGSYIKIPATNSPTTLSIKVDQGSGMVCFDNGVRQQFGPPISDQSILIMTDDGGPLFITRDNSSAPYNDILSSSLPKCPNPK